MFKWIAKLMDRIFVVAGALLFLQAPLFIQQYKLQLMGHVEELKIQIESMRQAAQLSHKTLDQYIGKFLASSDPDFARQGEIMSMMVVRWRELSDGISALENSTVLMRPWVMATHLNYDIFQSTLRNFEMGITFTMEGLVYMLFGIFCGYFVFLVISKVIGGIFSIFRPRKSIKTS